MKVSLLNYSRRQSRSLGVA